MAVREGNNILGVYACDTERPPVAVRYLVDPSVPGAEISVSRDGKKYTVSLPYLYLTLLRHCSGLRCLNELANSAFHPCEVDKLSSEQLNRMCVGSAIW